MQNGLIVPDLDEGLQYARMRSNDLRGPCGDLCIWICLTTRMRYVTAVVLSGSLSSSGIARLEDPPPGEAAILHQSKQRIPGLVGCCRRYRATAACGLNGTGELAT